MFVQIMGIKLANFFIPNNQYRKTTTAEQNHKIVFSDKTQLGLSLLSWLYIRPCFLTNSNISRRFYDFYQLLILDFVQGSIEYPRNFEMRKKTRSFKPYMLLFYDRFLKHFLFPVFGKNVTKSSKVYKKVCSYSHTHYTRNSIQ